MLKNTVIVLLVYVPVKSTVMFYDINNVFFDFIYFKTFKISIILFVDSEKLMFVIIHSHTDKVHLKLLNDRD